MVHLLVFHYPYQLELCPMRAKSVLSSSRSKSGYPVQTSSNTILLNPLHVKLNGTIWIIWSRAFVRFADEAERTRPNPLSHFQASSPKSHRP